MALARGCSWLGRSVPRQLLPRMVVPLCGRFLDGNCTPQPPRTLGALPLAGCRFYSTEREGQQKQLMVLGIPNPLLWLRSRVYYFLIRAYFDQDFNIQEFSKGARQAFTIVSKLLSQCNFDALKELVVEEVLQALKEKCATMPESHKLALAADSDEIMYLTPGDVGIYYDDNGRKFVSILMRFWYLTSANLPEENTDGTKVFQIVLGDGHAKDSKRLLTANYEFRREFTKGAAPDWIITRIEHSKLLN